MYHLLDNKPPPAMKWFLVLSLLVWATNAQELNCSIGYQTYITQCIGCTFNGSAPFTLPPPFNNFTATILTLEAENALLQTWLTGNFTALNLCQGNLTQTNNSLASCQGLLNACDNSIANNATALSSTNTTLNTCLSELTACLNDNGLAPQPLSQQIYTPAEVMLSPSRQLNNLWTGPLVRLQLVNGTQQDFYPSGGILNIFSVLQFAGNGTAYVTILYDQSGNNLHYVQETLSVMPIIAQNGLIIQQGGRPALLFNSTTTASVGIPSWYGNFISSNVLVQGSLIGPPAPVVAASILVNLFANSTNSAGILGRFGWNDGLIVYNPPHQVAFLAYNAETTNSSLSINNGLPISSTEPIATVTYGTVNSIYWTTSVGIWVDTIGSFFSQNGSVPFLGILSEVILWSLQPSTNDQNAVFLSQRQFYDQQFFDLALGIVSQLSTVPTFAFSMRLLSSTYAGACMSVRRSSDNAVQSIGFNATGDLDVASLLAFVGTANGTVQVWFDQSGNSNNAIQTNATNQPLIVTSGVVNTDNGRATITFGASNSTYLFIPTYKNAGVVYGSIVLDVLSSTTQGHIVSLSSGTNDSAAGNFVLFYQQGTEVGNLYGPAGSITVQAPVGRLQYAVSYLDGFNQNLVFDGSSIPSIANANNLTVNRASIGGAALNNVTNFVNANINELIVWNTAPSVWDLQLIQASQAEYYSIGPFPVVESLDVFANTTETDLGMGSNYVALSTRLVVNAYLGKCLMIRRSSDGTTQNIGFTVQGNLDVAALLAFVGGSNNGTIAIWYDQSGNGNNAIQTNATHQPILVQNGALLTTYTGRPAPTFHASAGMYLQITGFSDMTTSIFGEAAVTVTNATASGGRIISASAGTTTPDTTGNLDMAILYYGGSGTFNSTRNTSTATISGSNYFLNTLSTFVTTSSLQMTLNGVQSGSVNTTNTAFGINTVWLGGSVGNNSQFLDGTLSEIFLSSTVPTALAQNKILTSQQAYFGTYNAPVSALVSTAPAFAYGFRLLVAGYNGPLFQVIRLSDSNTTNIYPDPQTGRMNTSALLAFVGPGGTGFVQTWYDQTSTANLIQFSATPFNIPTIVSNGVIVTMNGQPCLNWPTTANFALHTAVFTLTPSDFWFMQGLIASASADTFPIVLNLLDGGTSEFEIFLASSGTHFSASSTTTTITPGTLYEFQAWTTSNATTSAINGVLQTVTGDVPEFAFDLITLANSFAGSICELYISPTPSAVDRQTLWGNTEFVFNTGSYP